MQNSKSLAISSSTLAAILLASQAAGAANNSHNDDRPSCNQLPSYSALKAALTAARLQMNGGFNLDMWATVVNRDGVVCAVAFTGKDRGDQWPGSRVISAQKANTANAFSLPALALSTANLYSATQPGGTLFGLQHSNPVNTDVAYRGSPSDYGQNDDPMVGGKIGGVNVFGGGLALYNSKKELIGAIGVSGDSSCRTTTSPGAPVTPSNSTTFPPASPATPPAPTTSSTTSPTPPGSASGSAHQAGDTQPAPLLPPTSQKPYLQSRQARPNLLAVTPNR